LFSSIRFKGGATAIVSSCFQSNQSNSSDDVDPWLRQYFLQQQSSQEEEQQQQQEEEPPFPLLFDVAMLERYILLCAQEINGGLRDKPSKPRDFYHTCYNLSGLSVAQHYSSDEEEYFGDPIQTLLRKTHPCYNIRIDRVAKMLAMKWEEEEPS
jgi:protein farnesyltransferase subunit beta